MRTVLLAVVFVAAAGLCAKMALWQAGRYRVRRAQATELRDALAAPPLEWRPGAGPAATDRRLAVTGTYDARGQVLLADRWRGDSAGVRLVTPLRTAGGVAVLVDRGWLPSTDAIHAASPLTTEPGERRVVGMAEPLAAGAGGPAWDSLDSGDGARLWSARRLDLDSLRARLPGEVAPFVLVALPDSAAPALPSREPPVAPDPAMHLSYAVQWCLFALGFVGGAIFVVARERSGSAGPAGGA